MKIHKDIIQGTDEWLQIRCGKFTSSDFHIFLGNSETKKTQLLKKASEIVTGKIQVIGFKNDIMERGNELESEARELYQEHTLNLVDEVGFVELNQYVGCSPDGFVGEDGMIEIKCPLASTFINHFVKSEKAIKPVYRTQIKFNLYVTRRKWCDYVCYHPDFENKLFIHRFYRNEDDMKLIEQCLNECISEVKQIIDTYNKSVA